MEAESISTPSNKESCFFHLKDRPVAWLRFLGERGDCWWGKVVGSFLSVSNCAWSWCSCGFPAKIFPCTCWPSPWEERRGCSSVRSRWHWVPDFYDKCQVLPYKIQILSAWTRAWYCPQRGEVVAREAEMPCAAWAVMLRVQGCTRAKCWAHMWPRVKN